MTSLRSVPVAVLLLTLMCMSVNATLSNVDVDGEFLPTVKSVAAEVKPAPASTADPKSVGEVSNLQTLDAANNLERLNQLHQLQQLRDLNTLSEIDRLNQLQRLQAMRAAQKPELAESGHHWFHDWLAQSGNQRQTNRWAYRLVEGLKTKLSRYYRQLENRLRTRLSQTNPAAENTELAQSDRSCRSRVARMSARCRGRTGNNQWRRPRGFVNHARATGSINNFSGPAKFDEKTSFRMELNRWEKKLERDLYRWFDMYHKRLYGRLAQTKSLAQNYSRYAYGRRNSGLSPHMQQLEISYKRKLSRYYRQLRFGLRNLYHRLARRRALPQTKSAAEMNGPVLSQVPTKNYTKKLSEGNKVIKRKSVSEESQ